MSAMPNVPDRRTEKFLPAHSPTLGSLAVTCLMQGVEAGGSWLVNLAELMEEGRALAGGMCRVFWHASLVSVL